MSVFSLLVRFQDDGNFASCAFSHYGEDVQLYHVSKGQSDLVAQSPNLPTRAYEPWKNVDVGTEVEGSRVSCFLDGQRVLAGDMPGLPSSGTVGVETWDPNPNASPHTLVSFTVASLLGGEQ